MKEKRCYFLNFNPKTNELAPNFERPGHSEVDPASGGDLETWLYVEDIGETEAGKNSKELDDKLESLPSLKYT